MSPIAKADAVHSLAQAKPYQPELVGKDDRPSLISDPIVLHLRACLQTARVRPSEMCSSCLGHLEAAVQAYLRRTHSVIPLSPPETRGGLAPWQLRRAQEMMRSHLDEAMPLAELARALSLSPGHFARAFKQTTGQSPHRWLMEQRIDKAKQLLTGTTLSLAEIALKCGFADQSHFTHVFSRVTHSSPGAWRRHTRSNPPATDAVYLRAVETEEQPRGEAVAGDRVSAKQTDDSGRQIRS